MSEMKSKTRLELKAENLMTARAKEAEEARTAKPRRGSKKAGPPPSVVVEAEAKKGPTVARSHHKGQGAPVIKPIGLEAIVRGALETLRDPRVSSQVAAAANPFQAGRAVFVRTADQDYVGVVAGFVADMVVLAGAMLVSEAILATTLKGGLEAGNAVAEPIPEGLCALRRSTVRAVYAWKHPLPQPIGTMA